MTAGLLSMKSVLTPQAKRVLLPLGLTAAASATDAAIQKKLEKLQKTKISLTNIYRIQRYSSIICGYFCIGFIDLMLNSKGLLDYTNLFHPREYEKNEKIILKFP